MTSLWKSRVFCSLAVYERQALMVRTCVVHDNNRTRVSDCLKDGQRANGIKSSSACISNHGRL